MISNSYFYVCAVYLEDLRQACFEYFKLGGAAVSGPVGLLSVYVGGATVSAKNSHCQ